MSIIINLKETRKNVEQSLSFINRDEKLGNQIRFQHVHTLNKIIYLQACRLSHYAGLGMLREGKSLTAEDIACNKPKVYLAKSCQVTSKTIQNHIKRLEEKQLIKRINKNGKLLLIVNPMLLSISPNLVHIQAILWKNFQNLNSNNISYLDFSKGKTFPINNLSGNLKSIITTSVNKLTKESPSDKIKQETTQDTFQETQKTKLEEKDVQVKTRESTLKLNPSVPNRKPKHQGAENLTFKRNQFVQRQVMILWMWCVEHLYSDRSFISESQEEYGIEYFTKSFEGKYGADLYTHISTLRTRLGKWKRFVSKDAAIKRFTPLPNNFFNPTNSHGFVKTEAWLTQEKRKVAHNKAWKLARNIERKAAQILSGYYPEKKTNPLTNRKETYYRALSTSEKIKELQKLEYSILRLSEKFPNIGKWYKGKLREIVNLVETKQVA